MNPMGIVDRTKSLNLENDINLPDSLFWRLCQDKYGINRGVYNTIDLWFYKNGKYNLLERRHIILNFLMFVQGNIQIKGVRLEFGHGGLSKKLNEFWEKITTKALMLNTVPLIQMLL
jgi:riboflavin kinase